MPSLKQIRKSIRSVQKISQITKTMQMVSASRLKRSEDKLRKARPYAVRMENLLEHILNGSQELTNPLFEKKEGKNIALILITSDRGLCGSYNTNIISKAEEFIKKHPTENVKLILIGKKGGEYFKKKDWEIIYELYDLGGKVEYHRINEISKLAKDIFISGKVSEVYIFYSSFISALSNKPTLVKLLNIESKKEKEKEKSSVDYIFEPNIDEILNEFLPEYITMKIYISMCEGLTSENSARMVAMKTATDNAKEMVDSLTLKRNKARQTAITKEILEIVTAGEALKS